MPSTELRPPGEEDGEYTRRGLSDFTAIARFHLTGSVL
jgi:hypothetical protein